MPNQQISSLHSPQLERVKALLHSRGKKVRKETGEFVVDSYQAIVAGLNSSDLKYPVIKTLFISQAGLERLSKDGYEIPPHLATFEVTPEVLAAMSDVESSQGLLAICTHQTTPLEVLLSKGKKIAYFWQLQDPGNAGTIIRSADASGFDSVIFSNESVDLYSPKVIRSTVGSLWNIPVLANVELDTLIKIADAKGIKIVAFDSHGNVDVSDLDKDARTLLIFGNEARGLPSLPSGVALVAIPMRGGAESFNVASAATIAMYELGLRKR